MAEQQPVATLPQSSSQDGVPQQQQEPASSYSQADRVGSSGVPIPQNGSLYVGDLDPSTSEADLYNLFTQVGPVLSVRVCRDTLTRRSLGYAYVNFQTVEDAVKAIEDLNYVVLNGRPLRVVPSQRDPSTRRSGVGNTFIKNLAPSVDQKGLYDTFMTFGKIISCKIATDPGGNSKGHGFVQFEDDASMNRAIEAVNGKEIEGQQVFVGPFKRREDRGTPGDKFTNVYVKNLAESVTDEKLKEVFGEVGTLSSAVVMRDVAGKSRGFGFVNYERAEDAADAVDRLNGHTDEEKEWEVTKAQKKAEREAELRAKFEKDKREKQDKLADSNLYIKNLDDGQTDDTLRQLFEEFGTIISCKVLRDQNTGASRGVGFVQLSTPEEATKAISELNNKMINGKPLYVAIAQKKQDRQRRLKNYFQQPQAGAFMGPQGMNPGYYGGPQNMGYFPGAMNGPGPMPRPYGGPQAMGMMQGMRPPMPYYGMQEQMGPYAMQQQALGMGMPGRSGRGGRMPIQGGRMGPSRGYGMPGRGRGGMPGPPDMALGMNGPMGGHMGGMGPGMKGPMGGNMPAMPAMGPGGLRHAPGPHMNGHMGGGSAASAISSLPSSLPGQSISSPLSQKLASAPDAEHRRMMLGEDLYPIVHSLEPQLAGKITGMLLEMSEGEVLHMLADQTACRSKVQEAKSVLIQSGQLPDEASTLAEQVQELSVN